MSLLRDWCRLIQTSVDERDYMFVGLGSILLVIGAPLWVLALLADGIGRCVAWVLSKVSGT